MNIDLHVHTSERSPCATSGEEEQIRAAIQRGLDGIAFTDHHQLVPSARLCALNEQYAPFRIFSGIEITTAGIDWVVLGLHDPALESRVWNYADLIAYVHQKGGFIFLAHPFRHKPELGADLEAHPPDGIEAQSINTPPNREEEIEAYARQAGLLALRNSDAHHTGGVGTFHNVLPRPAASDRELVEVLLEMKAR